MGTSWYVLNTLQHLYIHPHKPTLTVSSIPVSGNYLMAGPWGSVSDTTLRESYQFFLTLRQKGIRAHSWI